MAMMKVELMPGNASPISVTVENIDYSVSFMPPAPGGLAAVPRPIAMALVTHGICRDRGQVPPGDGPVTYPDVTPAYSADAGRVTRRPSTAEEIAAVAAKPPA